MGRTSGFGMLVVCGGSSSCWGEDTRCPGWCSYPPGLIAKDPFLLFSLPTSFSFPSSQSLWSLRREQLVFAASACVVGQTAVVPLPTTSSAGKVVLASRWTSHHLLCCCYSLCGQVHSLSGVQMDRSLRCLCVLSRGASPRPPLQLWISS